MRRRLSLALLAVLVILAVGISVNGLLPARRAARKVAPRDTLVRRDSAARADAPAPADTMCLASRIGLPCDPR